MILTTTIYMYVGDFIELKTYQDSGANLATIEGSDTQILNLIKVG